MMNLGTLNNEGNMTSLTNKKKMHDKNQHDEKKIKENKG